MLSECRTAREPIIQNSKGRRSRAPELPLSNALSTLSRHLSLLFFPLPLRSPSALYAGHTIAAGARAGPGRACARIFFEYQCVSVRRELCRYIRRGVIRPTRLTLRPAPSITHNLTRAPTCSYSAFLRARFKAVGTPSSFTPLDVPRAVIRISRTEGDDRGLAELMFIDGPLLNLLVASLLFGCLAADNFSRVLLSKTIRGLDGSLNYVIGWRVQWTC